jgi:hypothetical protein
MLAVAVHHDENFAFCLPDACFDGCAVADIVGVGDHPGPGFLGLRGRFVVRSVIDHEDFVSFSGCIHDPAYFLDNTANHLFLAVSWNDHADVRHGRCIAFLWVIERFSGKSFDRYTARRSICKWIFGFQGLNL